MCLSVSASACECLRVSVSVYERLRVPVSVCECLCVLFALLSRRFHNVFTGLGRQLRGGVRQVFIRLPQWSEGLDNSVGVCGCLCVLGSAYVVLWDCQTPRKSLPTLLSSQLQQPIVWHVNSIKIIFFTGFFKSWSWI